MQDTVERTNGDLGSDSDLENTSPSTSPSSFDDFHRWQAHIALKNFGEGLHAAAKAIFPDDSRPQYSNVYVLMICWNDEDSNQPIFRDTAGLFHVFNDIYHFETEVWRIPNENSHAEISQRIQDFVKLGGDSDNDLKIVYYNGQAQLDRSKKLAWTRYEF